MKIKRIIYTTLLIIWMIVIFMFSSHDGKESESLSDSVTSDVIDVVVEVTDVEIDAEEKIEIIDNTRFTVRKLAHFTLYFILGILMYFTLVSYSLNNRIVLYSVLFCFIYACTDEVHQLFSLGRTGRMLDVIVDTTGSVISISLCRFFNTRIYKKKKI